MDNYVHDNNNPNVPTAGEAAAGPVGTGMSISGARTETVMHNTFANNGAWGNILVPYPDSGPPCTGGQPNSLLLGSGSCLYDEYGNAIIDNRYERRLLWQSDQWRLRPVQPERRRADQLLQRQHLVERINVGRHEEKVSFTRIYRRC